MNSSVHALNDTTVNSADTLYLTCARKKDEEDWYFSLLEAHNIIVGPKTEKVQFVMMDNTHFDRKAIEELIYRVQSSPNERETAWINAICGRLFLGMYKTDRLKQFIENKIIKKIDQAKTPKSLENIKVTKVEIGNSVPHITEPKLLSLSPEGEVIVEANVEYNGGLTIEIRTDFNWSYSSHMKPISMHLAVSVSLKKFVGRMLFKLKAPPTNRCWLGFVEMPKMEWSITPTVAKRNIELQVLTNIIESKINEAMAKTFVSPNMCDVPFCSSGGKGGIFGERVKVEERKGHVPLFTT